MGISISKFFHIPLSSLFIALARNLNNISASWKILILQTYLWSPVVWHQRMRPARPFPASLSGSHSPNTFMHRHPSVRCPSSSVIGCCWDPVNDSVSTSFCTCKLVAYVLPSGSTSVQPGESFVEHSSCRILLNSVVAQVLYYHCSFTVCSSPSPIFKYLTWPQSTIVFSANKPLPSALPKSILQK